MAVSQTWMSKMPREIRMVHACRLERIYRQTADNFVPFEDLFCNLLRTSLSLGFHVLINFFLHVFQGFRRAWCFWTRRQDSSVIRLKTSNCEPIKLVSIENLGRGMGLLANALSSSVKNGAAARPSGRTQAARPLAIMWRDPLISKNYRESTTHTHTVRRCII